MKQSEFMFVYDIKLSEYLKSKGIRYITKALNFHTKKPFTLYQITSEMQNVLNEWNTKANLR